MTRAERRREETGTTLLLFPAAVLIVFLLGAIAVDLSALHLARRSALRAASQAADDAAGAVDLDELHRTGRVRLDRGGAERRAAAEVRALLGDRLRGAPTVDVDPDGRTVRVHVVVEAHVVFGTLTGGIDRRIDVTATGRLLPGTAGR